MEEEGEIEKSVPRSTDWHHEAWRHEAWRVMPIGDHEGPILKQIMDYFSCSPLSITFHCILYLKNMKKRLQENPEFAEIRHGDVILPLQ